MFSFFKRPTVAPEVEDRLTPLEIAELLGERPRLRSAFRIGPHLVDNAPKRFRRHTIAPGVVHCTAGSDANRLLVCFAGRNHRPMMPVSVLLQTIDDRKNDLLLLFDRELRHFNDGIEGFASSLLELARRTADFAEGGNYRSVMTLGWSMGGLPALRVGRFMRAKRAIAIGGRFAWHVQRLQNGAGLDAFDPLCGCTGAQTPCLLVHGRNHAADTLEARIVESMVPGSRRLELRTEKHNPVKELFLAGSLERFYEILVDEAQEPRQDEVAALPI